MNISLLLPTYNRDASRLDRLLTTTEWQFDPFYEVVVIDASTDREIRSANEAACAHRAVYRYYALPGVNFPLMYNLGLREVSSYSDYIACTCVDILFDPSYTLVLSKLLGDGIEFARSQCALLPQSIDYTGFGTQKHWTYLLSNATRRFKLGNAVLCAHRSWWFRVHGFDEAMSGGLGVYDGDVHIRAEKDGLEMGHTLYTDVPIFHQWHSRSQMKNHNRRQKRLDDDPPVIKNLSGWGELP